MALNSHTSGGYWYSILTPRGATGTGARDTGATGMLPPEQYLPLYSLHSSSYVLYVGIYISQN